MAKKQLEVGAAPNRGRLLALSAALVIVACLWLGLSPPAHASGVEWQTYLSEDFSGTESMFYTGKAGEANYAIDDKGRYIVNGLDTESDSLSALTDSMYYYYVEAGCALVSSDAKNLAFVGLVFHYKKQDDGTLAYYVFYIYGDGYYGAKRVVGDKVDIALPLTKSDEIDVGATNVLAVEAQGSRFDLYINGKHVDGFTDLKLDGGGFGFYISKRSEGAFDDFKVKVEKRDMGQEPPDEPNSATDDAPTKFTSYSPPYIPKDPNRPVYPWEVGVDKSKKGKGKKPAEPVEPDDDGARVEDTYGPGRSSDSDSGAKQPEKKKPASPGKASSKVKPGQKKVEKPAAPRKEESKPKQDTKDEGSGQDSSEAPKHSPPPPEQQPGAKNGREHSSATAPSVEILPPSAGDSADAVREEQPLAPADEGADTSFSQPEPEPVPEPEPALAEPVASPSEQSAPISEAEPGPPVAQEPPAVQQEPEHIQPVIDEPVKPFIRIEKAPKEEKPKPEKRKPENPKPEKKASASPPAENPAEGMRGKQDDWGDPNSGSSGVVEVQPPAPAREAAKPEEPKQEEPKPEPAKLDLPPAPDEATAPAAGQETASAQPEPEPAPADEKTTSEDLSLLPAEEDSASPADTPTAPTPAEGEITAPQTSDPTKLADLPQVEHGKAPVVELQAPPAPPLEPQAPPAEPEAQPAAPAPAEPAPALDLPPAKPEPQPSALQLDPNAVRIDDDFTQPHWAVAESPSCTYRYFGAAYEINNLNSATMALSFQQETLANVEEVCDVEFLDGVSYVGFGVAARFSAKDGVPTYYGLFVCQSGEFMLLRVIGGKETILSQWTASPQLNPNKPNRIKLVLAGATISAYLNNELVTTVDDDAIASGGYALLAGPGVSARFDNFSLRGTR